MNCKECGTELNAINMSDLETDMCGDCVDIALDFIAHNFNGDDY